MNCDAKGYFEKLCDQKGQLRSPVSDEKSTLPVSWNPLGSDEQLTHPLTGL